jgi:hypothetical protein
MLKIWDMSKVLATSYSDDENLCINTIKVKVIKKYK